MVSIEQIIYIVPILALTASILYYALNLQASNKTQKLQLETRQMQLFIQIYEDISSKDALETWAELNIRKLDIDEYLQEYDSTVNTSKYAERARLWYCYNTIGELLRLNMIDEDLLHRLNVDNRVIVMWENWEHIVKYNRNRENVPDLWNGFEYLNNQMKRFREGKGYPDITYNR